MGTTHSSFVIGSPFAFSVAAVAVAVIVIAATLFAKNTRDKDDQEDDGNDADSDVPKVLKEARENAVRRARIAAERRMLLHDEHHVDYTPDDNEMLRRFHIIKQNTHCIFAKRARAWSAPVYDSSLSLETNIKRAAATLVDFVRRGEEMSLDGFVIEAHGPGCGATVEDFGRTLKKILTILGDVDPSERGETMQPSARIATQDWVFRFDGCEFFVTGFASCYPSNHPRYAFGAWDDLLKQSARAPLEKTSMEEALYGGCFVLLQPLWAFEMHNVGPNHPWNDASHSSRQKIRRNFESHGRKYYVPPTRLVPDVSCV
eukprot:Opistho-2@48175